MHVPPLGLRAGALEVLANDAALRNAGSLGRLPKPFRQVWRQAHGNCSTHHAEV
jgi:hypothetical protein